MGNITSQEYQPGDFSQAQIHEIKIPDDKWFTIQVDNSIDPMDVVRIIWGNSKGWRYLGPKLKDPVTYQVKLVRLGHVRNLAEARKKADRIGCRLVEGQAMEPFMKIFPRPDRRRPIIFGGSRWMDPFNNVYMVVLDTFLDKWYPRLVRVDYFFNESLLKYYFQEGWRWLVASK